MIKSLQTAGADKKLLHRPNNFALTTDEAVGELLFELYKIRPFAVPAGRYTQRVKSKFSAFDRWYEADRSNIKSNKYLAPTVIGLTAIRVERHLFFSICNRVRYCTNIRGSERNCVAFVLLYHSTVHKKNKENVVPILISVVIGTGRRLLCMYGLYWAKKKGRH